MLPVQVFSVSGIHSFVTLTAPVLSAAKKTSSGSFTLIFIVLLFAVGYMFLIRPQRQRRQRQMQVSRQIEVGDRVLLSSGIIGRVKDFAGDQARIEIAPGVIIDVARRAVARRLEPGEGSSDPGGGSNRPFR